MELYWVLAVYALGTATQVQSQGLALTVARLSNLTNPTGDGEVAYEETVTDVGSDWNSSSNYALLRENSIYFYHMNAATLDSNHVNLTLSGISIAPQLLRSNLATGVDTASRSIIAPGLKGARVSVRHDATTHLHGDTRRQTAFTAFDLLPHLSPVDRHIFSVAGVSSIQTGHVLFDEILVNIGGGWNNATSEFDIPVTGYYFLTASAGIRDGADLRILIDVLAGGFGYDYTSSGRRMVSTSAISYLSAGQHMTLFAYNGVPFSGDGLQTSFSAFHYNPTPGTTQVAWQAYLSFWAGTTNSSELVVFSRHLDTHGAYSNGVFTAPRSGLYFIQLDVSCYLDSTFTVNIVQDDSLIVATVSHQHNQPGTQTTNQALLLELTQGTTLKLVMEPWGKIYDEHTSSFCGLLLKEYV